VTDGQAWLAPAFAFQVYFDFSGYSDIAIGLALIFGVKLPINFDAPFRATTILEFWQRWHMTLARFLREYLFEPLLRLRLGGPALRVGRAWAALLVTMAICGLWHGAGWTFVLWGALQGVAMIVAAMWRRYMPPLPNFAAWALTFSFVVIISVFFRAGSLEAVWHIYEGFALPPLFISAQQRNVIIVGTVAALALPATHRLWPWLVSAPRRATVVALASLAVVAMLAMTGRGKDEFVYFQF
jgi:D-alanyl-lipoteichoic acid acyltransferase DltB (MBOAT superfamily)